ncbi:DUF4349 domain-containing protein [Roseateles sp.]|uniref:DUF4349 domain-containing protein n=1 Tax=Roseateles sp. TaxID=1971397 RepID=UPI0032633F8A
MTRLLITCLLLVALAGCSEKSEYGMAKNVAPAAATAAGAATDSARRTLAYKHSIRIDAQEDKVAAIHEVALAACRAASAEGCTVLESRISTGRFATASLQLRMQPSGIPKLIAALGKQADITDQSTQAEDLARPISDGEKKLAMLTTYRTELEALRKRSGNDVDALIKVTHELAEVQGELEAASGSQAHLLQRVETEILEVAIRSEQNRSFWRPISLAASDFGGSLSQGVATAITGVAYLLPWTFVIGLAVWITRKLWRRRKPH